MPDWFGSDVGFCEGGGVTLEIVIGELGLGVACGLGDVMMGVKVTFPRLLLFLESKIVWLIVGTSVVPHQLFAAFMLPEVEPKTPCCPK